jgi:hypothetical protein
VTLTAHAFTLGCADRRGAAGRSRAIAATRRPFERDLRHTLDDEIRCSAFEDGDHLIFRAICPIHPTARTP